ncbi:hypothetical protein [Pontibacter harenae]|uniref:hypothetical protein n=1 Tax=Pontibacter harenae TaxID=2894083 RepID=UPI001E4C83CB|nr:hypothetical protein [Pontibacter harenae]MCC9166301.1 hypothetical protein [Pontibacter harenae]
MPEQMGKKVDNDMFQTNVTYMLTVSDSSLYNQISQDLLRRNLPFNVNVMGTFMESNQKVEIQQQMMQQAMENAKTKLKAMVGEGRDYQVVRIEELDLSVQMGPEYYEYNRRMIARLKVKAKLL